ncbi:MAG: hypothetical protein ACTSYF_07015 [Promethearchaeota archaeon]
MPDDEKLSKTNSEIEKHLTELAEKEKRLNEIEVKLNAEKVAFLQNKLLSYNKDSESLVKAITNAEALESLIKTREEESKKEKEEAAKKKKKTPEVKSTTNAGIPKVVMPDGTVEKSDIHVIKMNSAPDIPEWFMPDPMAARKFLAWKSNSIPVLLPPDKDHPYERFVA